MAEVRAQLENLRMAPRKVRAVAALIKKRDVVYALNQLEYFVRRPAPVLAKLIRSAVANAENSYHMVKENLYIKNLIVEEGMKLKRYLPRAQGRATEIQKKTSRIILVLDERVPGMKQEPKKARAAETEQAAPAPDSEQQKEDITPTETKKDARSKQHSERELGKKPGIFSNLRKRFFSRKAV